MLILSLLGFIKSGNGQTLTKSKDIIISLYSSFNERDFPTFYSKFNDSVLVHFSNNQTFNISPNQIKKSIDQQLKAFPRMKDTILQINAENDWVTICVKHAGTNEDSLWGIPPTQKYVDYNVIEMYRIKNSKIAEVYVVEDFLSMYQQMGIIPKRLADLLKTPEK